MSTVHRTRLNILFKDGDKEIRNVPTDCMHFSFEMTTRFGPNGVAADMEEMENLIFS